MPVGGLGGAVRRVLDGLEGDFAAQGFDEGVEGERAEALCQGQVLFVGERLVAQEDHVVFEDRLLEGLEPGRVEFLAQVDSAKLGAQCARDLLGVKLRGGHRASVADRI